MQSIIRANYSLDLGFSRPVNWRGLPREKTSVVFESTHIYNSSQIQNYTQVRSAHSDPTHIHCGKSCKLSVICMQQVMWLLKASCHAILRAILPARALHLSLNAVHVSASFVSLLETNCFIQSYVSVSLWMQIPASVVSFLKTVLFNHHYVSISLWMQHNCFIQLYRSISLWMQHNCFINYTCLFLSECSTTVLLNYTCLFLSECSTTVLFNYTSISLWMQHNCFIQLHVYFSLNAAQLFYSIIQYKLLWTLGPFYSTVSMYHCM